MTIRGPGLGLKSSGKNMFVRRLPYLLLILGIIVALVFMFTGIISIFETRCSSVPFGTVLSRVEKGVNTGKTIVAKSDQFCYTGRYADDGTGRLEHIVQEKASKSDFVTITNCLPNTDEVPADHLIREVTTQSWNKRQKIWYYSMSEPAFTSAGNFCYGGKSIFVVDNYTEDGGVYPVIYHRLESMNQVLWVDIEN